MNKNTATQPFNRSGNALSAFERNYDKDPNQFDFKSLIKSVGGYARIRILSLSPDHVRVIPCRKINVLSMKSKQPLTITVEDLGEQLEGLQDYTGEPVLGEKNQTDIFRIPVWVYGVKPDEKPTTQLDTSSAGLYYIEVGRGVVTSINKLKASNDGLFEFDANTGCPEYDLRLKKLGAMPYWDVEGIHWEGKGPSPSYNVPVENVLADQWNDILASWGDLMNAMQRPFSTLADIKRQLGSANVESRPMPISQRPALQVPTDYEEEPTEPTQQRFAGLRQ